MGTTADLREGEALSTSVVPVARFMYGGSAGIYALLTVLYLVAPPAEPHLVLASIFALGAVFFAAVRVLIPHLSTRTIEPLVLLSAVLAEAGAIAFVPLTGDPKQSVVVVMVIVATGAVMPTMRSAAVGVAFGVLGWLGVALVLQIGDFAHWMVNVAGAGLVSLAVSMARLRAIADLQLTRFMTDRAHDAIYLVTEDGRIHYVNDAACTMLGFQRDELLRMAPAEIDPVVTPARWRELWTLIRRDGSVVVQATHRAKGGATVPVELSFNLATLDGRDYICAIARDVTERREVEAKLERARYAAEAASRAKSEFLATMSHEIRTPLNGIFGMTELALEADDAAERREFILGARSSAEILLVLLNDILDYSQLESGHLKLDQIEFDPRELGPRVASLLAGDAQRRGLALRVYCDPTLPARLRGDPRRLRQALTNLVANALKFTERGEVELRLEREAGDDHDRIHLLGSVRDTGIGIPPGHLATIFEPFTQVDSSNSRRYGGVGLGLSLARDLVEAMGGTIEVASTPGIGSTFSFRVPVALSRGLRDGDARSPAVPSAEL